MNGALNWKSAECSKKPYIYWTEMISSWPKTIVAKRHTLQPDTWSQNSGPSLKSSHTLHYIRNDVCRVFVSQEKKHFFMKKYFFALCTTLRLCQSRAWSWKSSIFMKNMIFIDFQCFPLFSLILVKNHENLWFSMLLDVPRIRC